MSSSPDPEGRRASPLVRAFLSGASAGARARLAALPELENRLSALVTTAEAQWPTLKLDAAGYLAHLAAHLPHGEPDALLSAVRSGDLYLAYGCALGEPEALRLFEAKVLPSATRGLKRSANAAAEPDEVLQRLRQALLVPTENGPAKISEYAGLGTLSNWIRASAIRLSMRLERRAPPSPEPDSEELLELQVALDDTELKLLKTSLREPFAAAFREAFAGLSTRERNVLRLHYLEGLSIDRIGAMHQVHRSSVARWLLQARERIAAETQDAVGRRCQLSRSDLRAVVALVQSQLESGLERLLEEP
ncbi:MAG: hypothetical protein IPJ65_40130 [Archangiaceae bacterium]|nr:hypothetical protein [Archangiaceae bacterium]